MAGENAQPQTDLSFATTEELIEELALRSEAMVFGSIPKCDGSRFLLRFAGHIIGAVGLTRAIKLTLDSELRRRVRS